MKILSILLLATLLSARKLIPLTKEKIDSLKEAGIEPSDQDMEIVYDDELPTVFPKEFDAREKWPNCTRSIPDEGECFSSWAFASSSAMSDRFCIASNQTINATLSAQHLLSCVHNKGCKWEPDNNAIFEYMRATGVPSAECVPYVSNKGDSPVCQAGKCTNTSHPTFDAKRCARQYFLSENNAIKQELFAYGPLYCTFNRYLDFDDYKSGIYYKVSSPTNHLLENHRAAKLIGWGEENGILFWMLMNSWGDKWGENGSFRIRMGEVNVCRMAGVCEPDLKS